MKPSTEYRRVHNAKTFLDYDSNMHGCCSFPDCSTSILQQSHECSPLGVQPRLASVWAVAILVASLDKALC